MTKPAAILAILLIAIPTSAQTQLPQLICDDQEWCIGGCSGPNDCDKIKIIRNNWPSVTHYTKTQKYMFTSETNCQMFNGRMNHTFTAVDGVTIEKNWELRKPGSIGWATSGAACQKAYKDRFIDKIFD